MGIKSELFFDMIVLDRIISLPNKLIKGFTVNFGATSIKRIDHDSSKCLIKLDKKVPNILINFLINFLLPQIDNQDKSD